MATFSKLQASIKLLHGDKAATIASLTSSFKEDYSHFATANNREALNQAVTELNKSPKDKAISEAISEAYKAGALTVGYVGARTGKFSAQSKEVQDVFNDAIVKACEAFNASLEACEAFKDKAPKTEADKVKAKEAKEAKAKEDKEALIVAMVQSGEIVRACDVKKIEDFAPVALIDALMLQGFDVEALKLECEALKRECEALKLENESLKASKKAKVKATA